MKKLIPLVILLIFVSCKSIYPNEKKLKYTAPVKVGDNYQKVKEQLGNPEIEKEFFMSYFKIGMVVYTNDWKKEVVSLVFTWFKGGTHFEGEIYGIGIGDTYPKVVQLWGEPAEVGNPTEDYYEKMWQFKKFGIAVQFWAKDGNDEELGGFYETDTVKRIQINL